MTNLWDYLKNLRPINWAREKFQAYLNKRGRPAATRIVLEPAAFCICLALFSVLTYQGVITQTPPPILPADYVSILDQEEKGLIPREILERELRQEPAHIEALTFFDGLNTVVVVTNEGETKLSRNVDVDLMRSLAKNAGNGIGHRPITITDLPAAHEKGIAARLSLPWMLAALAFAGWFARLMGKRDEETEETNYTVLSRRLQALIDAAVAKSGLSKDSFYKLLLAASLIGNLAAYQLGLYYQRGVILPADVSSAQRIASWQAKQQLTAHPEKFVRVKFVPNASAALLVTKDSVGTLHENAVLFGETPAEGQAEYDAFLKLVHEHKQTIDTMEVNGVAGTTERMTTLGTFLLAGLASLSAQLLFIIWRQPWNVQDEQSIPSTSRSSTSTFMAGRAYGSGASRGRHGASSAPGGNRNIVGAAEFKQTRLDEVEGVDEAKEEIQTKILDILSRARLHKNYGSETVKGVLLYGPPGTGKTMLARAIATEVSLAAGIPAYFAPFAGSEFVEQVVGTGAMRIREGYTRCRMEARRRGVVSFFFVDEIDALAPKRSQSPGPGSREFEHASIQLFKEMDGFDKEEQALVVTIATTNRLDVLDPAVLREGRFDIKVEVGAPDTAGRRRIYDVYLKKRRLLLGAPGQQLSDAEYKARYDVLLDELARKSTDFVGASIAAVTKRAVSIAVQRSFGHLTTDPSEEELAKPEWQLPIITRDHLHKAVEDIAYGLPLTSRARTPAELWESSVHEIGHAAGVIVNGKQVNHVSIVRTVRGRGRVHYAVAEGDAIDASREELEGVLIAQLSGRAAQEVILKRCTAGASDDFDTASRLARQMVGSLGMSDVFRTKQLPLDKNGLPVGNVGNLLDSFNSEWVRKMDDAQIKALDMVKKHRKQILTCARALYKQQTLKGAEFEELWKSLDSEEHYNAEADPADLLPLPEV